MKVQEKKISKDISKQVVKLQTDDSNEIERAAFTHFLQHRKNGVSKYYKKTAIKYAERLSENENIVAENPLEYQIFNYQEQNGHEIPFPALKKSKFQFIDLFAGVGGFRLALQNIGGKCVYTSEWEKSAKQTYEKNFGEIPFGDITSEKIKGYIPENFDLLCGGFPCQAFSVAGNRKGFEDTRGTLFFDLEKIIETKRPKAFFLENVKNLAGHDKGRTLKIMLNILENKLGYKVYNKVLNSMEYANVPQNRERIFIVGFDPKQVKNYDKFSFPEKIDLTKNIRNLIDKEKQDDKYYYKKEHQYYPKLIEVMKSQSTIYQWRRVYVRENKSNVCPTLTANMGTGGHNVPLILDDYGIRKLTPRECFRFQGYPENYVLPNLANSKLYMQAS
ncbi:MAG: DNA (cytosine-5-)-methyltransferase [Bacteroidota bacterium]|nr:DNA (cytosine-5-)-methyltransferase [Bacteroidota bacterium]